MRELIILTLAILLIPLVLATTDDIRFIAKEDQPLNITEPCFNNNTYCSDTSKCNITIKDPEQRVLISNLEMINMNSYHAYDLNATHTNTSGVFEATVICKDGIYNGYDNFYFKITYHGKEEPSGFTQVMFIISFVIILGVFLFTILLLVQHLEQMDFDIVDLCIMLGIYFVAFSLKYFNLQYMGSSIIDRFSDIFITVGAFTHIILPTIVFIICFFKRRLELKEEDV